MTSSQAHQILNNVDSFANGTASQVPLEHPKRFRIEMTFSRGADISTLEVIFIPFKCLEDVCFIISNNLQEYIFLHIEWGQSIFAT